MSKLTDPGYPRQSPFWAGARQSQTTPPQHFYAEQGYVSEPVYLVPVNNTQPTPQVQYYVNGSTGPLVYYYH